MPLLIVAVIVIKLAVTVVAGELGEARVAYGDVGVIGESLWAAGFTAVFLRVHIVPSQY